MPGRIDFACWLQQIANFFKLVIFLIELLHIPFDVADLFHPFMQNLTQFKFVL
jgi:hypothetical protein